MKESFSPKLPSERELHEEQETIRTASRSYSSQMAKFDGTQQYHLDIREMLISYVNTHGPKPAVDTAMLIQSAEEVFKKPSLFYTEGGSDIVKHPISDARGKILAREIVFGQVFDQLDRATLHDSVQPYFDAFFLLTQGVESQDTEGFRNHVLEVYTNKRNPKKEYPALRQATQDILRTLAKTEIRQHREV